MPQWRFRALFCSAISLCLLFVACKRPATVPIDNEACPAAISGAFTTILGDTTHDEAFQIKALKRWYTEQGPACHNELFPDLVDALFDKAYRNPLADTTLAAFFRDRMQDPSLNGKRRLKALLVLAAYYNYVQKMPDSAGKILAMAHPPAFTFTDSLSRSFHSLMAEVTLAGSQLQEAASHYMKALELAEQLRDSTSVAALSVNFANLYSRMQEWDKAISLRHKGISYFRSRGENNGVFISYVGIGSDYGHAGIYDSARKYNRLAESLLREGSFMNPIVTQTLYSNIAGIAMTKNHYDTARLYFDKVRTVMNQLPYSEAAETFYLMSATIAYAPVRDVSAEISKIKNYIDGYYRSGDIQKAKEGTYSLYNIAYIQDKPVQALDYYQTWDSLKNVMAGKENLNYVAELETRYQTRQKELKIRYQQEELRKKRIQNILLMVFLFSLILVAAFIISRIQLSRRKKEAALQQQFTGQILRQTEEERIRIARDLHDDIGQNLVVLKNSLRQSDPAATAQVDRIIAGIRLISRNLHPVILDQAGLAHSVAHLCQTMMEHNEFFISSEISYNRPLPRNAELQLFRIIQEALNNILKHAGADAAKVTITEHRSHVLTTIQDNGKGFSVAETLKRPGTFGLLSLFERSRSVAGKTEITSSEKGTIITIQIPYPDV